MRMDEPQITQISQIEFRSLYICGICEICGSERNSRSACGGGTWRWIILVVPLDPSRDLVLKKLGECFPDPQVAAEALAILDSYGTKSWHRERERVQLAILMQSEGKLERLRQLAGLADKDFRDALVGAEYPEELQASSNTSPQEMSEIRKRDREQYEAWLLSGGA
jgi:hypothetical protein